MGQVALAEPPVAVKPPSRPSPEAPKPELLFQSLVPPEVPSILKTRSLTLGVSLVLHSLLVATVILVPILASDSLPPAARDALRAFLVAPTIVTPPPPPPPPPAASAFRVLPKPVAAPAPVSEDARLIAPIEVPEQILPEPQTFDLGVEGGVPGGVEGGVPGGVVGGVVGGLPDATLPAEQGPVVRVGGKIIAPKLIHDVKPVYPELAALARVSAIVILEARVDTRGYVKSATVLRGSDLFNDAAVDAVKQWRYKPLLLNGVPTEFLITVTISFRVRTLGVN
jgi:protein TonB